MIDSSTPIFAVRNIIETVAYYRDVLGFRQQWLWGDPPTFGCIELGEAQIFLSLDPALAARMEGVTHFLGAENVDALYEIHRARGADISRSRTNPGESANIPCATSMDTSFGFLVPRSMRSRQEASHRFPKTSASC